MNYDMQWLADASSVATFVITFIGAIIGIYGYTRFRYRWYKKRKSLETYLKAEKDRGIISGKQGQHTMIHLVRHVGLTEDEIIKLSFDSKKILRKIAPDESGYATALLFEYGSAN